MFAELHSDINSLKSVLFHLTGQPDSKRVDQQKSKVELFHKLNSYVSQVINTRFTKKGAKIIVMLTNFTLSEAK